MATFCRYNHDMYKLNPFIIRQAERNHPMHEDAQEVVQHLYLGPAEVAKDAEWLRAHKITHILDVGSNSPQFFSKFIHYLSVPIDDVPTAPLLKILPKCHKFIYDALSENHKNENDDTKMKMSLVEKINKQNNPRIKVNEKINPSDEVNILVHCQAGVSRSPAVVVSYFMWQNGWSLDTALSMVRSRRQCILINPGFYQQLKHFEKFLTSVANNNANKNNSTNQNTGQKQNTPLSVQRIPPAAGSSTIRPTHPTIANTTSRPMPNSIAW